MENGTIVATCPTCKPHEFQDKEYGFKKRLHNCCSNKKNKNMMRCTVCGELRDQPHGLRA